MKQIILSPELQKIMLCHQWPINVCVKYLFLLVEALKIEVFKNEAVRFGHPI